MSAHEGTTGRGFYLAPRNWLLAVVLGLLVGAWFASDGKGGISRRQIQPLVQGFDASQARTILLERPDLAAVETGGVERTTLTRRDGEAATGEVGSPDVWTIEELHGAAAFTDKIDRLLARIGAMTTLDLVSEDTASYAEYGLGEDRALHVRIANGEVAPEMGPEGNTVELWIAPAPGRAAYVRAAGDARVWRIARYAPPSPSPLAWFDDSSLMPLTDRAIRVLRASGRALDLAPGEEFSIRTLPGADHFQSGDGEDLSSQRVFDLFKRLRLLFPEEVLGTKVAGERLESDPWLSIEVEASVGGKTFRIDFSEPGMGADPSSSTAPSESPSGSPSGVRAALVGKAIVVSLGASGVEKIVESLKGLRE